MLTTIVGGLWILRGLFFLYKPDWLKGRLQKKGVKGVRRLVFALSLAAGILLLGAAWDLSGIVGIVVGVIGGLAVLKAFFFLRSKASESLIEWIEPQPLSFFRAIAVLYIVIGVAFVLGYQWKSRKAMPSETGRSIPELRASQAIVTNNSVAPQVDIGANPR